MAYPGAAEAETHQLFGCSTDELYKGTGGKKGDRSTLPAPAQEAYAATEVLAKHALNQVAQDNKGGTQGMKDDRVVEVVSDTAGWVRKWLSW